MCEKAVEVEGREERLLLLIKKIGERSKAPSWFIQHCQWPSNASHRHRRHRSSSSNPRRRHHRQHHRQHHHCHPAAVAGGNPDPLPSHLRISPSSSIASSLGVHPSGLPHFGTASWHAVSSLNWLGASVRPDTRLDSRRMWPTWDSRSWALTAAPKKSRMASWERRRERRREAVRGDRAGRCAGRGQGAEMGTGEGGAGAVRRGDAFSCTNTHDVLNISRCLISTPSPSSRPGPVPGQSVSS